MKVCGSTCWRTSYPFSVSLMLPAQPSSFPIASMTPDHTVHVDRLIVGCFLCRRKREVCILCFLLMT